MKQKKAKHTLRNLIQHCRLIVYVGAFALLFSACKLELRYLEEVTPTYLQAEAQSLSRKIQANPTKISLYRKRAKIHYMLDFYEFAVSDYNFYLAWQDDCYSCYVNRGLARAKLGEYKGAFEDFTLAIEMSAPTVELYHNRAVVAQQLGLYQQALDDFRETVHRDPTLVIAYVNRSILYFDQGDFPEAIQDLEFAMYLDSTRMELLGHKSMTNYALGKTDEAIRDLDQWITQNPEEPYAYYLRGVLNFNLRNFPKAADDFRFALKYREDEPLYYLNLGNALREDQKYEAARMAFEQGLAFAPENDLLRRNIKEMHDTMKKKPDG